MKLQNIIRISIEDVMCQKTRFLLSVILIGMGLFGIGYFHLFSSGQSKIVRQECDRMLTRGIDGTGLIRVENYDTYEAKQLKKDAIASGMVEYIGTWEAGSDLWESELTALQRTFPDMDPDNWQRVFPSDDPNRFLEMCCIDRTALGICSLCFSEKAQVPEEQWKKDGWHGIYLGGNFRDIPLGTVYEREFYGKKEEYEVIGILEKGQYIPSIMVIACGEGDGFFTSLNLDSLVVCVMEMNVSEMTETSAWAYVPGENVKLEEARAYLAERAGELGVKAEFAGLRDGFTVQEITYRDLQQIDNEIYATLFLSSLLINSCIMAMQVIGNKKNLGIYYACGFSRGDIIRLYVCQNVLRVMTALGLSWMALRRYCQNTTSTSLLYKNSAFRWLNQIALPQMFCFGIVLIGIFSVIPICMIWRGRPAELMKDSRG